MLFEFDSFQAGFELGSRAKQAELKPDVKLTNLASSSLNGSQRLGRTSMLNVPALSANNCRPNVIIPLPLLLDMHKSGHLTGLHS